METFKLPTQLLKCGDQQSKLPTITYNLVKEEFEDTKGVIRIRKSKKNRQHNGQMKKYKKQITQFTSHVSPVWKNSIRMLCS
jgi:hypothetical protein